MTSEQETAGRPGDQHAAGSCICHDVLDQIGKCFDVSPTVRQHLMNSRVEFLKAIRAVIDQRIERLSASEKRGSRITVE
ncbi:MAG: hypothetical protein KGL75_02255 [Acidobacteriota bacterium]|nr:hypothetical protein [Acidobacteriota bacterium]